MYEKALNYAEEELSLFPKNEEALDLIFFILFKLNNNEKIPQYLNKYSIEIETYKENPNAGLRFFILGYYFKKNRIYKSAEFNFKKALLKGYNPIYCYIQLMDIYLIQNQFNYFKKELREAVKSYGVQPEFFSWMRLPVLKKVIFLLQ